MPFEDIFIVTDRLEPATAGDVADAEAATGIPFPPGYAEFVTRFGDGAISNWVRVYPPSRVAEGHPGQRARRDEYYFWDEGAEVLTREQVAGSLLLADTLNGDEVIYHPADPTGLYVLPEDDGMIYAVGGSLSDALAWLFTSGELTAPIPFRAFEPAAGRARRRYEAATGPSFEVVRDALRGLALHDHAVDATEGEDKCYDLFVRECGGVITIVEGEGGAVVGLRTDAGARGPKLGQVVQELRALGLEETPE